MAGFTFYPQPDQMDCGPTCLRMIAKYYGRNINLQKLRQLCEINKDGVSLLGISDAAEKLGFRALGAKLDLSELKKAEFPCILHWRQNHFVVLYRIKRSSYYIADPLAGLIKLSEEDFKKDWTLDSEDSEGIALIINPTPDFFEDGERNEKEVKWRLLLHYLTSYKQLIIQLLFGLGIGSVLQLIVPFLTQSIVDIGINTRNLNFVYLILAAEAMLILGRVSIDFIRSWILLHVSTRINISILTDFLIKLMKLPMGFFDSKRTGDIMQRMNDQKRIETFLTGPTLNSLLSAFNLIVFSMVLAWYNIGIFFIFISSSLLYLCYITLFLKYRRSLDYKSFDISAQSQSSVFQLINGMQEIKLNNCERNKRWEWEHLQARLFKFRVKSLALNQYQQGGATFINESTGLLITFLSAKSVIDGQLTIGGMLAVQYIVGQLNLPIQQFLNFIQGYQDAKISLERLNEIHQMEDEESPGGQYTNEIPKNTGISLNRISFQYAGAGNEPVINDVIMHIPSGKTTAIVGMSGSGKTTILKLLLRYYQPEKGEIRVGKHALNTLSFKAWRSQCGVVMQDGFIFSDTIEKNISVSDDFPDPIKLKHAINVANIGEMLDSLPLGKNTKIGAEGNGISQGQRQRILIARAVYKDPQFIFFDEATNSLDANNERIIMNNLREFFHGRTVVIVAHRLSTVSNADNIVVLDKGRIIEQGTHSELTSLKGDYYRLVKNQLELGS